MVSWFLAELYPNIPPNKRVLVELTHNRTKRRWMEVVRLWEDGYLHDQLGNTIQPSSVTVHRWALVDE